MKFIVCFIVCQVILNKRFLTNGDLYIIKIILKLYEI